MGANRFSPLGERHRQQRALLLPRFHGKAVANYQAAIDRATERGLTGWPVGKPVPLADVAQQITLDIIMSAVFGLPDPRDVSPPRTACAPRFCGCCGSRPRPGHGDTVGQRGARTRSDCSLGLSYVDKTVYRVLDERRSSGATGDDILSLLLTATDTDGNPLSDTEIRDELMTSRWPATKRRPTRSRGPFERLTCTPGVYRLAAARRCAMTRSTSRHRSTSRCG